MGHLPKLIEDLALILIAAAFTTLLFRKIKQPLILGYIIAGFLVGPYLSLTPSVVDTENIKNLAEIGVIFLLFSLGLEFSFKKLMRIGGTASITGFIEIAICTSSGYALGRLMNFSVMDSLFFGGMMASSSTTVIIRAFEELQVKTKQFARVVFGILVVEDIVVILLMVLLSTVAITQKFEGSQMLFIIAKLLFFLMLWFITGIFLLPTFLKRIKKLLDDETLLILSIGLCLGMVVVATQAGFSAELGAFIMGSILAETTKAEKVEHLMKPVKNLFGAIFFVSVGMLIDPEKIVAYRYQVLAFFLLILIMKPLAVTIGSLVSGQPLKQSIRVGMSMGQIGEFAFIVATLGLTLGVISDFLFPVAVGASVLTTFTTPYLIRGADKVYLFVERKLPARWIRVLNNYANSSAHIQAESEWRKVIRSYTTISLTNGIVLVALFLISVKFLMPFLRFNMSDYMWANITGIGVSLLIAFPFLWALMAKRPNNMAYKELWLDKSYNHGPLVVLETVRVIAGILIISFWVDQYFTKSASVALIVCISVVILFLFNKGIQKFHTRLEGRFISNFNSRDETSSVKNEASQLSFKNQFKESSNVSPWDVHLIDLQVNPHAEFIGKTLEEVAWREAYGINVAYIKRGDNLIYTPGRNNKLLPFDNVGIISTDEQFQVFKPVFDNREEKEISDFDINDINIQKIVVDENIRLKGKSIRESKIREITDGLILGIERKGEHILNPTSETIFEWGDYVWIVGDRKKINKLKQKGEVS